MVKKIFNILLGTFRNIFKIRPKYYDARLKICDECEHKKKIKGFGEYCDVCGCIIKSKISVKSEKCYLNKW